MSASISAETPASTRLGKYRLLAPLAEGGMARVFIAQRDGANDICVLKQLLAELVKNEVATVRFQREAHLSSLLVHPRIARITDAGFEDESFCIAMEFIAGKDLESMSHAMLRSKRLLPYQVSVTAIVDVLEALAYAHEARDGAGEPMNVVHRDLSPRNVMMGFDGRTKVIDFGMAKGNFDAFRTRQGVVLGTLRYVSPEQAQALDVDLRSDLYTVGVLLHELLTGRMMVEPGEAREILKHVVLDDVPKIHELNPQIPAAIDAVVRRALMKDPKQRWASAGEFRAALLAASGDWGQTPPEVLAAFMAEQFPDDLAAAQHFRTLGDTTPLDTPISRTTLAAEALPVLRKPGAALSAYSEEELGLTTKTGFDFPMIPTPVDATRLVEIDDPDLVGPAGTMVLPRTRQARQSVREVEATRERKLAERNGMLKGALIGVVVAVLAVLIVLALR